MIQQPQPADPRQQWVDWAKQQKVPKRYRAKAADVALAELGRGASPEQAAAAAHAYATEANAGYYATAGLIFGVIAVVVAIVTGGVTILFGGLAVIGGIRGLKSSRRQWQAIVALVLAALAVGIFVLRLVLRSVTR